LGKSLSKPSHILLGAIEMRKLVFLLTISIAIFFIMLNSFAADGNQLNLTNLKNNINDNGKFITFKDEEGNPRLFKTLALIKFGEGKVKFEIGDFSPIYQKRTNIPEYRTDLY
jgi:hypothetical protein